jgi:hypothetical protein
MPDSNPSLAHFRKKVLKNNKLAHGAKRGLNAIDITLITIGVAAVQEEIVVLAEPRLLLSAEFDSHIRLPFLNADREPRLRHLTSPLPDAAAACLRWSRRRRSISLTPRTRPALGAGNEFWGMEMAAQHGCARCDAGGVTGAREGGHRQMTSVIARTGNERQ